MRRRVGWVVVSMLLAGSSHAGAVNIPTLERREDARDRHSAENYETYQRHGYQAPLGGYPEALGDPAPLGTYRPGIDPPNPDYDDSAPFYIDR